MGKVYSKALGESLEIQRIIGHIKGKESGPTVVFFAGIHGNEPAGVFALHQVVRTLKLEQRSLAGECFAIAGNLKALENNVRYMDKDLNRIWSADEMSNSSEKTNCLYEDVSEQNELKALLTSILEKSKPPFYFIDLHTTSSPTSPFMVLNDSLLNRKFATNYPLPIILGIEEYLDGALLSYINELGYVSLGFESGSHDDIVSIQNSIDFVRYTLGLTGCVDYLPQELEEIKLKIHNSGLVTNRFYEIYYQHDIEKEDVFNMFPGFSNFQKVPKGTQLAIENGETLITNKKRQIFMPLYQKLGSEGFYFIQSIPAVLLWISKLLRKVKLDHILAKMPGIRWKSRAKDTLIVDQRVAKYLAKSIFHLLGYRARQLDKAHLIVKNRESASRKSEYKNTQWY